MTSLPQPQLSESSEGRDGRVYSRIWLVRDELSAIPQRTTASQHAHDKSSVQHAGKFLSASAAGRSLICAALYYGGDVTLAQDNDARTLWGRSSRFCRRWPKNRRRRDRNGRGGWLSVRQDAVAIRQV